MSANVTEILEPSEQIDERVLLADLFHAVNQPLSALRCSMELALLTPRTPEEYRNHLQAGLEKIEQASLLIHGIRELLEAKEPSVSILTASLQDCLHEAIEHFLPVTNDKEIAIISHCAGRATANFDPECLRRALFYVFDLSLYLISGKKIEIWVREDTERFFLTFIFEASPAHAAKMCSAAFTTKEAGWQLHLKWVIARQLFHTQQGSLAIRIDGRQAQIQASIPRPKIAN